MINRIVFGLFMILTIGFALTGCGDGASDQHQSGGKQIIDKTGPEYTAAWICPMYCKGSGSAEPGVCPVCNMQYVKNPDLPKASPSDNVMPSGSDSSATAHGSGHEHS